MKKYLSLTLLITALINFALPAFPNPNWRMHITFDDEVDRIIETPEYVYFTGRTLPEMTNRNTYLSLFRYDKEGDELQCLSTDNKLTQNNIEALEYSPTMGCLIVVYANSDIDLVYDNGKVVNIPTYRLASIGTQKNVNSITVDVPHDRIYMATDFGYFSLNGSKAEISESRNYGVPLKSVARMGENILILTADGLAAAPASSQRMTISDYEKIANFKSPRRLAPLSDTKCLILTGTSSNGQLKMVESVGENFSVTDISSGKFYNIENNKNGVTVAAEGKLLQFDEEGKVTAIDLPVGLGEKSASSYNLSEIWQGASRKGIKSGKASEGGWTVTRDFMLPDAPSPFIVTEMDWHPDYGMMLVNYGQDYNLNSTWSHASPILLSAYDSGRWYNYGPAYTNPSQISVMNSPNGFAIDPDNSDYVYLTSRYNGIVRLNLSDPQDVIHLSRTNDPAKDLDGFIAFVPDQMGATASMCCFSAPRFDKRGNLWMSYSDFDNQSPERLHLYCWTSEDRNISINSSTIIPPKEVEVPGFHPANTNDLLPLEFPGHSNWLIYAHRDSNRGALVLIDTNGTPLDTNDDRIASINNYYDQDGNNIGATNIRCLYEDPITGYVWVGHQTGVFYFNPADFFNGNTTVYRVKVSRNDGTNLADYLLNEVVVNKIVSDASGRKWFATGGGGVVGTSSDGKVILTELNGSNSPLPADMIYGLAYNPDNNSLMISTESGLSEYFLSMAPSSGGEDKVRAYPNPVRPEYMGYVTIDGVPDNGIVKIVDSAGNLVKELGRTGNSEIKWDVTNLHYKRVSSGVYFILASNADDDSSFSSVGKILVVN